MVTRRNRYRVKIRHRAEKNLYTKIPRPWRNRIRKAIEELQENPFYGEKMWGKFANRRKIRVWPYRIVYQIYEGKKLIHIERIDHRGSIGY